MSFYDSNYSGKDFRRVERFYTQFWYNQVDTAPGLTWCTQYFYKKMKNGKYRYVMIDKFDDYLSEHAEFPDVESFSKAVKREAEYTEYEPCILGDRILSFFPEDLRPYPELIASEFNEETEGLLYAAISNNDKKLIAALLPDFENIRKRIQHITKDQFRRITLESETTDDDNLKYYFDVEIEGSMHSYISYTDGDNFIRDEEFRDDIIYIDQETIDLFHEVYDSEYQEWEM